MIDEIIYSFSFIREIKFERKITKEERKWKSFLLNQRNVSLGFYTAGNAANRVQDDLQRRPGEHIRYMIYHWSDIWVICISYDILPYKRGLFNPPKESPRYHIWDMSTLLDKNISRKMTILVISYYPQMGNPCYNFHCYYRSLTSLFTIRSKRDDWGTTWSNRNSFFKVLKPEWDLFNRE